MRNRRGLRAVIFLGAGLVSLVAGQALRAQEVDHEESENPACGMGYIKVCRSVETCVGYGGNMVCKKDFLHFNP